MADKYPDMKVTVINFTGPRVGNQEFKDWSEAKSNLAVWRYVYNRDIVPRLGPMSAGYRDAGQTFQIWPYIPFYRPKGYSEIYYRHVGNGGSYVGAPNSWYLGTGKKYNTALVCTSFSYKNF